MKSKLPVIIPLTALAFTSAALPTAAIETKAPFHLASIGCNLPSNTRMEVKNFTNHQIKFHLIATRHSKLIQSGTMAPFPGRSVFGYKVEGFLCGEPLLIVYDANPDPNITVMKEGFMNRSESSHYYGFAQGSADPLIIFQEYKR